LFTIAPEAGDISIGGTAMPVGVVVETVGFDVVVLVEEVVVGGKLGKEVFTIVDLVVVVKIDVEALVVLVVWAVVGLGDVPGTLSLTVTE
jgi:hypothetical protein